MYPDPDYPDQLRYHDGTAWTDSHYPRPPVPSDGPKPPHPVRDTVRGLVALLVVLTVLIGGIMALMDMEPSEADLRRQGYTDCSDWTDYGAIVADAECFEDGELVNFYDSGASRGHYDPR